MQRRKKQLLGLVGLALVAAITAIAFAIPAPGASAADDDNVFEHGVGVKVQVGKKPIQGTPSASLGAPSDGFQTVAQQLKIKFSYENANGSTKVTLDRYGADGTIVESVEIPVNSCNMNGSGECELTYDLGAFPFVDDAKENTGVKYKLTVLPKYDSKEGIADFATFYRRAAFLKYENKVNPSTNDPYVSVYVADNVDVEKALIQVYDKTTKQPIFMEDGKEVPLTVTKDQIINAGNGKIEVMLPFSEYGLKGGTYLVTMVAYGADETKPLVIASEDVPYTPKGSGNRPGGDTEPDPDDPNKPGGDEPGGDDKPVTPEVPGTGSIFRDLNISRADYILVGLIAFGLVAGFAIFLIVRRNKR